MLHKRMITYTSRQLKLYKVNYHFHHLEFITIVFALGCQVQLFTNYKSLKNIMSHKEINIQQRKCDSSNYMWDVALISCVCCAFHLYLKSPHINSKKIYKLIIRYSFKSKLTKFFHIYIYIYIMTFIHQHVHL
jgi:hypothetical protein